MNRKMWRSLVASIVALAMLVSCMLAGLVLPASAATDPVYTKITPSIAEWWLMTGRYRDLCTYKKNSSASELATFTLAYTYTNDAGKSVSTTKSVTAGYLDWSIDSQNFATLELTPSADGTYYTSVMLNGVKAGETVLTATIPGTDISCKIPVHVIDGSKYEYFTPEYTYGENVVVNGDFEGTSVPWKLESNRQTDVATYIGENCGKDGTRGLKLLAANDAFVLWNLSVVPTYTYKFSFDYKAPKGTVVRLYHGNGFATVELTSKNDEWNHYEKIFTVTSGSTSNPPYKQCRIYTGEVDAENPVIIDNFEIRERISAVQVENLLTDYEELLLQKNETWTLKLQTEPYGGDLNGVVWESSDTTVATVVNGKVTTLDTGVAEITATTRAGISATCRVVVTSGKDVIQNGDFEDSSSAFWKTESNGQAEYAVGEGINGSAALRLYENDAVTQENVGIQPNIEYNLMGSVNLPVATQQYLLITVKNGEDVLATSKKYCTGTWDNFVVSFTAPAVLSSNVTTVSFDVIRTAPDHTSGEFTPTPGGSIEQGDGVVTDPDTDEDIAGSLIHYGYLDNISMIGNQCQTEGMAIDLTPVDLKWTGDNGIGQAKPGSPIVFSVSVKNIGSADLPANQGLTVDIAANTKVIRTLRYDGAIAAGETVTLTDTAAWTAVAGDHMISARVNATRNIYETNLKTNQTIQLNLRVAEDTYVPKYNEEVIAQAGMDRLTMSDDFSDLSTVDKLASGSEGYKWYVTRPWGAGTLQPHEYAAENGILTLMGESPSYNISFNSVDMYTNNGFRYNQGYLEVKLRVVRPNGLAEQESGIPAVWSFTQDKALENITGKDYQWVELDWLEYWGITKKLPKGYYTTTFHHSVDDKKDSHGNLVEVNTDPEYTNTNHTVEGLGDAEWHVMGWLWEHNRFRAFLDGVQVQDMLIDPEASTVPLPSLKNEKMVEDPNAENFGEIIYKTDADGNFILSSGKKVSEKYGNTNDPGPFTLANVEKAVLYLSGSKDSPMEVDYVRIWQASEPQAVSDSMTLDQTEITMDEGNLKKLTVTVPNGEDAGTLSWKSSDPSVATVHGNGTVYARGTGKTVVTATNANGISVMCNVTVKHNLLSGGDFEFAAEEDLLYKHWGSVPSNAESAVHIAAETSGNRVLAVPVGRSHTYANATTLQRGKTYQLSGRYKGAALNMWFNAKNGATSFTYSNKTVTTSDTCTIGSATSSWKTFSVQFTTAAEGVSVPSGWNVNHLIPQIQNKGSSLLYLDDLVLTEVENVEQDSYTVTTGAMTNGSVSLKVNGRTVSSGSSVTPGTFVDVTVAPSSGYQLKHGSLTYSYTLPAVNGDKTVTRKALNKNDDEFGAGTGKTFRFVMPAEDVTLSAVFEQITAVTDGFVATLGTSVHLNEETKEISGVRFLNRLYHTAKSDPDNNIVYVMHDGEEKRVAQFGSLLKRASNDGELTLDGYEIHKNDGSATRIWKSESIKHGGIYLVDYTDTYMDFTIVMTSAVVNRYAFLDRGYTVCGYVVLEDGTTIYTEAFTDSVLDARTRDL